MQTKEPKLDIADAIRRIIVNDCVVNDRCDDGQPCTADDRCFDRVCRGTPIVGCRLCVSDMDCEDGSVCTVDTCENGSCVWTPGYDAAMHCCDPADGSLAVIDDGKVCTIDTCNMMTGEVAHPAADVGVGCDDHKPCTIEDVCDGQGGCRGRAIGSVSCQSDADCYGQVCDAGSGLCVCEGPPDLCLVASPSELPGEGCYAIGDLVTINVELGPSASTIVGGSSKWDTTRRYSILCRLCRERTRIRRLRIRTSCCGWSTRLRDECSTRSRFRWESKDADRRCWRR